MADTREGFTNDDWLELCKYVEKDILNYDDNMKLSRDAVLRLRGLSKGQFIANNNAKKNAEYSYKLILITFKAKKLDILRAIHNKKFKNERQKFNYIMAIIENSINDIYKKIKENEKSKVKAEKIENNNIRKNDYKKQEDKKSNKVIEILGDDIW